MNADPAQLATRFKLQELKVLTADPQVLTLRFSADGKFLLAGGYDAEVRRWDATQDDLPERKPITGHHGWTQAICTSPDGSLVFTGDSWGELRATPLAAETPEPKWRIEAAHQGWLRDVTISPDGAMLASCGRDRTIRLWSAADGGQLGELKAENDDLYIVRFSPDGQHLVAGDRLGVVYQWELASKQVVRKFDSAVLYKLDRIQDVGGVRAIAFDKAGTWLAVGGMKPKNGATIQGIPTLLLFDWKSGELKQTHELGGNNDCDVMDVHLHDDGFFIAVTNGGPGQGKGIMQQLAEKTPFLSEGKIANVQSLAWHPSGKRFAVSGTNSGSNGNGRNLDKEGKYPGNRSPIHMFAVDHANT